MTNFYELLGVGRDASDGVIRDSFRRMARDSHPDRFTDPEKKREAERKFALLTEAVNVLTSPARRKAHDFDLDKGSAVAASHDPASVAKVYLAKGVKAYKENDYLQALAMFDMAVHHHKTDPKALHYLGMACIRVPNHENARKGVAAMEAAIRLEPHNGVFHRDLARLYLLAGLRSKADRHLEEALRWNPTDTEVIRLKSEMKPEAEPKKPSLGGIFGRKG